MNQALWQWILGVVDSAKFATKIEGLYGLDNIAFTLSRRNSPYKSHRQIEFRNGGCWHTPCFLMLGKPGSNDEDGIGFSIERPVLSGLKNQLRQEPHLELIVVRIPAAVVRAMLQQLSEETGLPVSPPPELRWLHAVVIRRKRIGWNNDGTPQLATRQPIKLQPMPPADEDDLVDLSDEAELVELVLA